MFRSLEAWDPEPFRRALARGGYTQDSLKQLGLAGTPFQGRAAAVFRESLPAETPLRALACLFMLGDRVPVERLYGPLGSELGSLTELGVLEAAGGEVWSRVHLVPYGGSWFASDFLSVHASDPGGFVMGLSPVTRLLAALMPKRHGGGKVLELGCGAGWYALQARRAGNTVTATDISPRALAFARFNACLAGIEGIDWRAGSWFEPVAGKRFDLIAANPPFVQSPGGPLTFREISPGAEHPCRHILRGIRDHLDPGGISCMLLNWCHRGTEDWAEAPLEWAPAAGLRRWLFQSEALSTVDYAWRWVKPDPRFEDETAAAAEVARWVEFHRASGTGTISSGFLVVQRCEPGEEWTRRDSRATAEIPINASEEVLRVLAAESWLRKDVDSQKLLESRHLVPDGIQAEIRTTLGDRGWQNRTIRLTSPAALSYDGQVDENLMRLLELCRKGARPADMVAELRAKADFAMVPDLDGKIAALARELVRYALLVPIEGEVASPR